MALTRKQLRGLGLDDETIETLIRAHGETVEALKQERDTAREEASQARAAAQDREALARELQRVREEQVEPTQLKAEFDAYRQQVQMEKHRTVAASAVRAALLKAGANEKAVGLLAGQVALDEVALDGGALQDEEAVIAPIRTQYADFFATPEKMAAVRLTPPSAGSSAITRESIQHMSQADINRNWQAVSAALAGR